MPSGDNAIRIENLVLNVAAGSSEFLGFETLTLCLIDTHCLDLPLLLADERAWRRMSRKLPRPG